MDGHGESVAEGVPRRRPVPRELYSVYRDGPFTQCTICSRALTPAGAELGGPGLTATPGADGRDLNGSLSIPGGGEHPGEPVLYEIQKVFRGPEVVFEMAICRHCGEQVAKEFSEESMVALKGFLLGNFQPADSVSHCHFCSLPVSLVPSWTLVAACEGSELVLPPITLCEACSEGLEQRLSRRTRDTQDEFVRDHFPGVPADLDFHPSVFGV